MFAARLTDMHTCPLCMGAPAPIIGVGAVNVLIGGLPAARVSDMCVCIPPWVPDVIAMGSFTVLIGGMPAARAGDMTAKGGVILPPCCPTVLIGMAGSPTITTPSGLMITTVTLPDGTTETHIGNNIVVKGTPEFQAAVVKDMQTLYGTETGRSLIDSINNGNGKVTVVETTGGNKVNGVQPQGWQQADGSNGTGSGSTLHYNPNRQQIGDGSEPWMTRPPAVALGHELVHCEQAQNGSWSNNKTNGTENDELAAVGLPPFENNEHTENKIREELGQPRRPRY